MGRGARRKLLIARYVLGENERKRKRTGDSLSCQFRESRFADDGNLDFAGIRELLFEGVGNITANFSGCSIVRVFRAGDDAEFTTGLDSEWPVRRR